MSSNPLGRRDRLIKQARHDAYHEKQKFPDPTVCTRCGARYSDGRWLWTDTIDEPANETVCPACRRVVEQNPAGVIDIHGGFYESRMVEVLNLINNTERDETLQHPMERLIQVVSDDDGARVTTTGVHIARRIGDAVSRAYGGEYSIEYLDDEKRVRISVERDD